MVGEKFFVSGELTQHNRPLSWLMELESFELPTSLVSRIVKNVVGVLTDALLTFSYLRAQW